MRYWSLTTDGSFTMDNSFNIFFKSLLEQSGLSLSKDLSINEIRLIISKINEYFYTNYDGIVQEPEKEKAEAV